MRQARRRLSFSTGHQPRSRRRCAARGFCGDVLTPIGLSDRVRPTSVACRVKLEDVGAALLLDCAELVFEFHHASPLRTAHVDVACA